MNDIQDMATRIVPTPWGDFEVTAHVEREPYRLGEDFTFSASARVADFDRFKNGHKSVFSGEMSEPITINGKDYPASTRFNVTANYVWTDTYMAELTDSARRKLSEHLSPAAVELLESAEVREELVRRWVDSEVKSAEYEVERAREAADRRVQRARELAQYASVR